MIVYLLYRVFEAFASLLPIRTACRLGSFLGMCAYCIARPYRKLAIRNLRIAFEDEKSPAEIRALARESFAKLGANLLSSLKVSTMKPEQIAGCVDATELDVLFKGETEGRGLILVLSHMGNWELLSQIVPMAPPGLRLGTIYQPLGNRRIDERVKAMRARFGVIPFDRRNGFGPPIQLLRGGGMVGVLVDQHAGDGGIWTPLFGRLASTSPLAAALALRTGAHLAPVSVCSQTPGRWKIIVQEFFRPGDFAGPEELTVRINRALEAQVRQSPADWFWVHNRWKTPRPDFLLGRYKRGVSLPPGMAPGQLKPFRILVRSSNWLGDAVMSAPAVRAIRAGRPDARITVLAPAKLADFWKTMPEISDIIAIEPGESVFSVARKIGRNFDAAFIFPNSVRAALEVFLGRVPRRVGYRRPWRGKLINQFVPEPPKGKPGRHQVHHYLAMAKNAGANADDHPAAVAPAKPPGARLLGLCPGAEYGPAKRWMPGRFAEVARRVHEQTGREWVLFGVENDAAVGEEIVQGLNGTPCQNLIGRTTLLELIKQLRQCRLLLTNDTGTMHLAAHLGVPVVAVFGSTEPALTGPLGRRHSILRHHVACSPCFLRECPLDFRCMESVTVEETVRAVLQELERAEA